MVREWGWGKGGYLSQGERLLTNPHWLLGHSLRYRTHRPWCLCSRIPYNPAHNRSGRRNHRDRAQGSRTLGPSRGPPSILFGGRRGRNTTKNNTVSMYHFTPEPQYHCQPPTPHFPTRHTQEQEKTYTSIQSQRDTICILWATCMERIDRPAAISLAFPTLLLARRISRPDRRSPTEQGLHVNGGVARWHREGSRPLTARLLCADLGGSAGWVNCT